MDKTEIENKSQPKKTTFERQRNYHERKFFGKAKYALKIHRRLHRYEYFSLSLT